MKRKGFLILALAALLAGGLLVVLISPLARAQASPAPGPLTVGPAMSSANFRISWDVVASGGGRMSSANFHLHTTIGQPAIGWKASANFSEHTGYWQIFLFRVFLPLVLRNYSF
ncbi:MAG: hypothetical protein RML46_05905 [Anaerolineae bacterium]|nr:hypothetical protein [Anaerolineae bacterium]MDW8068426.1 hypothetical protein [Anaerolineae bacterium]